MMNAILFFFVIFLFFRMLLTFLQDFTSLSIIIKLLTIIMHYPT